MFGSEQWSVGRRDRLSEQGRTSSNAGFVAEVVGLFGSKKLSLGFLAEGLAWLSDYGLRLSLSLDGFGSS